MSIKTTAYCESPTCDSTSIHVKGSKVTAIGWITANIADVDGEWFSNSIVHARHFCGYLCYVHYLTVNGMSVPEDATGAQEIIDEFRIDESLIRDLA